MILVTGARGVVGLPLCARLQAENQDFLRVSRSEESSDCVAWDLANTLDKALITRLDGVTKLIHCAPIWLLPEHLSGLHAVGVTRIIAFGSTSVFAKRDSGNQAEQELAASLHDAEIQLIQGCEKLGINLTILRPCMIYGYGRDQNVSHLARLIRRHHCMFVVGRAKGLRQPVHADDLVAAVFAVLANASTYNKQYTLAGGEVLSYRAMLEKIFRGLGKKSVLIPIPLILFRFALQLISKVSGATYTPDMANRMNMDLTYSIDNAQRDFGYQPQAFLSNPQRDLPGHEHA